MTVIKNLFIIVVTISLCFALGLDTKEILHEREMIFEEIGCNEINDKTCNEICNELRNINYITIPIRMTKYDTQLEKSNHILFILEWIDNKYCYNAIHPSWCSAIIRGRILEHNFQNEMR